MNNAQNTTDALFNQEQQLYQLLNQQALLSLIHLLHVQTLISITYPGYARTIAPHISHQLSRLIISLTNKPIDQIMEQQFERQIERQIDQEADTRMTGLEIDDAAALQAALEIDLQTPLLGDHEEALSQPVPEDGNIFLALLIEPVAIDMGNNLVNRIEQRFPFYRDAELIQRIASQVGTQINILGHEDAPQINNLFILMLAQHITLELDALLDQPIGLQRAQLLNHLVALQINELGDQLGEQLSEQLYPQRFNPQLDAQLDGQLDEPLDEPLDEQLDEQLDGPLDGPLDEQLDGPLDEQLDEPLDQILIGFLPDTAPSF